MYRYLRNTHLFLGLFIFLFVMMYGVSSVQMAHNSWFNAKPLVNESSEKLAPMLDARQAARLLMEKYGWRGELGQVTTRRDDLIFRVVRPGMVYEVTYAPVSGETKIKTNVANWIGMLNRIHHIGGFWHEYSLINVWAAFIAIVSVSLIVIALSGIYLWFKIHTERLIGGVLLAAGLIYGLGLMILLRIA